MNHRASLGGLLGRGSNFVRSRKKEKPGPTKDDLARWRILLDPSKTSVEEFLCGKKDVEWDGYAVDTKEAPAGSGTNVVKFEFWPGQRHILYDYVEPAWEEKLAAMLVVVKDREQGCSKFFQALLWERFCRGGGGEGRTVAQDVPSTLNLQWDFESFLRQTPEWVMTDLLGGVGGTWESQADGNWEFVFEGGDRRSKMQTMVARSGAMGRGSRLRWAHVSEYPWWSVGKGNLGGAAATWPDAYGNLYAIESTGRGEDEFKAMADRAKEGLGGWELVFLSWLTHPKKSYSFPSSDDKAVFVSTIGTEEAYDTKKERELWTPVLQGGLGATPEQLAWRRRQIDGVACAGNPRIFEREHPSVYDDAFMADSNCYFDVVRLRAWARTAPLQTERGDFSVSDAKGTSVEWVPDKWGPWRIYRQPVADHVYCYGCDPSAGKKVVDQGKREGDYAVIVVWDATTDDVAAIYRAHTTPEDLATVVLAGSKWYGWAPGYVERNNDGKATLALLPILEDAWAVPDSVVLAQEKEIPTRTGVVAEHFPGFWTDSTNKGPLMNTLRVWLRKLGEPSEATKVSRIPDLLLFEMRKFNATPTFKNVDGSQVATGRVTLATVEGHDDVVSAAAMGRVAMRWLDDNPHAKKAYKPVATLSPHLQFLMQKARREAGQGQREEAPKLWHPKGNAPWQNPAASRNEPDPSLGSLF